MSVLTFLKQNKQISILILVLLLVTPFAFASLRVYYAATPNLFTKTSTKLIPTVLQSTPVPTVYSKIVISPTSVPASQKMLDLIQNRRPLSSADAQVKQSLLSMLPSGKESGVLYETTSFIIEYIHAADLFQVEILSDDIKNSKSQAVQWFEQKGMSHDGVCHLPVTFYLEYQLSNKFRQEEKTFDPLPEGC